MKRPLLPLIILCFCFTVASGQNNSGTTTPHWSEADRQYLIDNLTRTRDLIVEETKNLSPAQWAFKESPERWSINQVVEHLGIWELLFDREISMSLSWGPQPELAKNAKADSTYLNFLLEGKVLMEHWIVIWKPVSRNENQPISRVAWRLISLVLYL